VAGAGGAAHQTPSSATSSEARAGLSKTFSALAAQLSRRASSPTAARVRVSNRNAAAKSPPKRPHKYAAWALA